MKKGVILTDVGSIKKYSIREIEENLPENADVVVVPGIRWPVLKNLVRPTALIHFSKDAGIL